MTYRNLIFMAGTCLLLNACVKHGNISPASSSDVTAARRYFTDSILSNHATFESYPAGIPKTVHWELARPVSLPVGVGVVVPVQFSQPLFIKTSFARNHFFNLDNLTQLLIYRDVQGRSHAEILRWMPDSNYLASPTGAFTGFLFVDDWWGRRIANYRYVHGQVLKAHSAKTANSTIITVCTVIDGYNYGVDDPENGYAWEETAGCESMYLPENADYGDGGGTGDGGGANNGYNLGPTIFIGHNIIADIKTYFQCFQNLPVASYKVTICVAQPKPGTRTPWAISMNNNSSSGNNMVDVGHTFMVFSENINGNMITRNVGFYPSMNISPFTTIVAQGALNNDESHPYNVSATFAVTSSLFFNMLNYVQQGNSAGYNYNLNSNNCTTFAINTLTEGHIYLPSTIGYWYGGVGNDPGDLGEDIKNSNAPGIVKSTTESSHSNVGTCN